MLNKTVVSEALKQSLSWEYGRRYLNETDKVREDSLISLLVHDIFGGEILKTHIKSDWHFYNRIEGERIDFTRPEIKRSSETYDFEDIPSDPDETCDYVDQADYSNFFMKFVRAFEDMLGLEKISLA
jgi:hypothetical protein